MLLKRFSSAVNVEHLARVVTAIWLLILAGLPAKPCFYGSKISRKILYYRYIPHCSKESSPEPLSMLPKVMLLIKSETTAPNKTSVLNWPVFKPVSSQVQRRLSEDKHFLAEPSCWRPWDMMAKQKQKQKQVPTNPTLWPNTHIFLKVEVLMLQAELRLVTCERV